MRVPVQVRRPHLTLQVAVGLSSVPLRHLLPVAPDVGQDLVQTGFYGSVGFIYLPSCHLIVEYSHILSGQADRKQTGSRQEADKGHLQIRFCGHKRKIFSQKQRFVV